MPFKENRIVTSNQKLTFFQRIRFLLKPGGLDTGCYCDKTCRLKRGFDDSCKAVLDSCKKLILGISRSKLVTMLTSQLKVRMFQKFK